MKTNINNAFALAVLIALTAWVGIVLYSVMVW